MAAMVMSIFLLPTLNARIAGDSEVMPAPERSSRSWRTGDTVGLQLNTGVAGDPMCQARFEISISVNRYANDLALARFRIDVMAALDTLKRPTLGLDHTAHLRPPTGLTQPRPRLECLPPGWRRVPSIPPALRRLPRERWPSVRRWILLASNNLGEQAPQPKNRLRRLHGLQRHTFPLLDFRTAERE
jgi:hypothetical protein